MNHTIEDKLNNNQCSNYAINHPKKKNFAYLNANLFMQRLFVQHAIGFCAKYC